MPDLDHLTKFVRDLAKSRSWYAQTLGLRVEFDVPAHGATPCKTRQVSPYFLGNARRRSARRLVL